MLEYRMLEYRFAAATTFKSFSKGIAATRQRGGGH
jgi:hypothetical protein